MFPLLCLDPPSPENHSSAHAYFFCYHRSIQTFFQNTYVHFELESKIITHIKQLIRFCICFVRGESIFIFMSFLQTKSFPIDFPKVLFNKFGYLGRHLEMQTLYALVFTEQPRDLFKIRYKKYRKHVTILGNSNNVGVKCVDFEIISRKYATISKYTYTFTAVFFFRTPHRYVALIKETV